jgi:MOSC domain-containing protein YiiM
MVVMLLLSLLLSVVLLSCHRGTEASFAEKLLYHHRRQSVSQAWSVVFANTQGETLAIPAAVGKVLRLATRSYHPVDSKPSSRNYTTRKDECKRSIHVTETGVTGDYNHYRAVALKGTPDRALSILTTDTLDLLQSYGYPAAPGDLGENILIAAVRFPFFVPGVVYRFESNNNNGCPAVDICITEPMIPCANLCKLPYINNETKSLKDRVATCQEMLRILDQAPGLRGWYAAVVNEGNIMAGSTIRRIWP